VSKDTHFERSIGDFHEFRKNRNWRETPTRSLTISRTRSLNQVAWGGDEPRVCFREGRDYAKCGFLVKWRKEWKCKGFCLNRFWICKGYEIKWKRGVFVQIGMSLGQSQFAKWRWGVLFGQSPLAMERMRWRVINEALMGKVVEVQFWKRKWDFWKFKTLWLRDKGREKEKRKKERKLNWKDIFFNSENYNIKTAGSRVKVESTENISENTEIVRNLSISERLLIFTKNL